MNKIINVLKKNYVYVNIAIFLLTIYVILFPIISEAIQSVWPQFNQCPYLMLTGKPCPLCGGTRYIAGLGNVFHDITYLFHPFGIIMIIIFLQFVFRLYNIITWKKEKSDKWIRIDLLVQIYLMVGFFLYEIIFIIRQNMK